jgi:hypothetical protein
MLDNSKISFVFFEVSAFTSVIHPAKARVQRAKPQNKSFLFEESIFSIYFYYLIKFFDLKILLHKL